MALRNQPYFPLYVQDFLTDEKLIECSPSATGIYIRLLCIMHKSDEYGTILLKQKDKQTSKQVENFAYKLAKHMPYSSDIIHKGLHELLNEGVLQLKDDKLLQKRMIRDNEISIKRAEAGQKGGKKTQFASKFAKAKDKANAENEYESENVIKEVYKYKVDFEKAVSQYPSFRRKGKDVAFKRFKKTVTSDEKLKAFNIALVNYLNSSDVKDGHVLRMSKFFDEWKDWVDHKEPETKKNGNDQYA